MSDRRCCNGLTKGILTGIAIAAIVFGIIYLAHPSTDINRDIQLIKGLFPRSNLTQLPVTESPSHPKDLQLKTTQSEIDELISSVETYKSRLPSNIVTAIDNLIADHKTVVNSTTPLE